MSNPDTVKLQKNQTKIDDKHNKGFRSTLYKGFKEDSYICNCQCDDKNENFVLNKEIVMLKERNVELEVS